MGITRQFKKLGIPYNKEKRLANFDKFLLKTGLSKNPKVYRNYKIDLKKNIQTIDNVRYIHCCAAIQLLGQGKSKTSKDIYKKIKKYEDIYVYNYNCMNFNNSNNDVDCVKNNNVPELMENIQLINCKSFAEQNNFPVNRSDIHVVIVGGEVYFRGHDVCTILEYKIPKDAVRDNVLDECKKTAAQLIEFYEEVPNRPPEFLNNEQKNTVYINEEGLYDLIISSRMKKAKEFRRWLTKDVLPNLRKHGSYIINPIKTDYAEYRINNLEKYRKYNVLYVLYLGVIDGMSLFKFGITNDIHRRYREHIDEYTTPGNEVYPVHIIKCPYNNNIEKSLLNELQIMNLQVSRRFPKEGRKYNPVHKELFTISNVHTFNSIKRILDNIAYLTVTPEKYKLLESDLENTKKLWRKDIEKLDDKDDIICGLKRELALKDKLIKLLE